MNVETIASEFQFVGSQIKELNLKNNFITLPEQENLKCVMDTEYEIEKLDIVEENRYGIVDLYVTADVQLKERKNKRKLKISICVSGCFTDSANASEEDFKAMLSLNGCAVLYGIARSQILSLSSQALCGGQIILPMVNLFKLKEQKEKQLKTNN